MTNKKNPAIKKAPENIRGASKNRVNPWLLILVFNSHSVEGTGDEKR